MNDVDNIASIGGQSPNFGQSSLNKSSQSSSSTSNLPNLHLSEIVKGGVIEALYDNLVRIAIPGGNFVALANGKLKSGDVLYFQVKQTKPDLVLKPYSLTLNNKDLSADEVIRLLDIPPHTLSKSVVEYLLPRGYAMTRDSILNIIKLLDDNEIKYSDEFIFEALFSIDKNKYPYTKSLLDRLISFSKFYNAGIKKFSDVVKSPEIETQIIEKIENERIVTPNSIHKWFNSIDQNSIFELVYNSQSKSNEDFIETVLSAKLFNTTTEDNAGKLVFVPVIFQSALWIACLVEYISVENRKKYFYYKGKIELAKFGIISFVAKFYDDSCVLTIESQDEELKQKLDLQKAELYNLLLGMGINLVQVEYAKSYIPVTPISPSHTQFQSGFVV